MVSLRGRERGKRVEISKGEVSSLKDCMERDQEDVNTFRTLQQRTTDNRETKQRNYVKQPSSSRSSASTQRSVLTDMVNDVLSTELENNLN